MFKDMPHDVVLCNFGGPTTAAEVEPFLIRLFEDPFIIRAPLGTFLRGKLARRIAKKRVSKSIEEYKQIGFSPINKHTEFQARALEKKLRETAPNTRVHVINRYTAPLAKKVVPQLRSGEARLFLLTLYPHFCHSTTASSIRDFDLAFEEAKGQKATDAIRLYSWWSNPCYLAYSFAKLKDKLEGVIKSTSGKDITILFSAHGLPSRYFNRGDPYVYETYAHFGELRRLGEQWLSDQAPGMAQRCHWHLSFQSRVGRVEWVKPYTNELLKDLGAERGGELLMVPISFTSDHIETMYEMDVTYKNLALQAGFSSFQRVLSANEDLEFTDCLVDVLNQAGFPRR
jgi:ferrochelatase